jgi:hypothetical protein
MDEDTSENGSHTLSPFIEVQRVCVCVCIKLEFVLCVYVCVGRWTANIVCLVESLVCSGDVVHLSLYQFFFVSFSLFLLFLHCLDGLWCGWGR